MQFGENSPNLSRQFLDEAREEIRLLRKQGNYSVRSAVIGGTRAILHDELFGPLGEPAEFARVKLKLK
jgi:hypothetical protein